MSSPTPEWRQPAAQPTVSPGQPSAPVQQQTLVPTGAPEPAGARAPIGGLSIATLVVSFFAGLVAVVLGVFALRQNWVRGTRGSGMAWAGIIIGAVLGVAQTWIFMLLLRIASNAVV